jgi:hypothetical protein
MSQAVQGLIDEPRHEEGHICVRSAFSAMTGDIGVAEMEL